MNGSATTQTFGSTAGSVNTNFSVGGVTAAMVISGSTGNVGIGETNPSARLDIAAPASDGVSLEIGGAIESSAGLSTYGASATIVNKRNEADQHGLVVGAKNSDSFPLIVGRHDSTFNDLVVAGSGRVGIGLTNGESVLDISGSSQYGQLQIRDGSANIYHRYYVSMSGAFGNGTVHHVPRGVPGSGTSAFTTHFKSVVGGGTTRHDVVIDGNVGIGDTSPDAILDVDNSASTTTTVMHLTDSGGTGTHTMLQLNNTGG